MNETQTKVEAVKVDTGLDDVSVLLLLPQLPALSIDAPMDFKICGRGVLAWVEEAVVMLPVKKIDVLKSDDIMTIVRNNATEHKYTVVLYADTPLLTQSTVEQAVSYTRTFNHQACKLPRGWVFETNYVKNAEKINTIEVPNLVAEDFIVAYNYSQIALINNIQRGRIIAQYLSAGVNIIDPTTTYIDAGVKIAKGVVLEPNVYIRGSTEIKKNCKILAGSKVTDSYIGEGAVINNSEIIESEIGAETKIGPYSHIRPGVKIGKRCRISNFVEIKKATIGDDTTIKHMTYVADAVIGNGCNIGCGVVFCNFGGKYDENGKAIKETCSLGDKVFVGSNTNLVAPLTIGDNAFIAAGSTITQDIPKYALGIARAKQAIRENWNNPEANEESNS